MRETGPAHDVVRVVVVVHDKDKTAPDEIRLVSSDGRAGVWMGFRFLPVCHRLDTPALQVT